MSVPMPEPLTPEETAQQLYAALAGGLHAKLGDRPADVQEAWLDVGRRFAALPGDGSVAAFACAVADLAASSNQGLIEVARALLNLADHFAGRALPSTDDGRSITLASGTLVRLDTPRRGPVIVCDNPAAPPEFRDNEVGRVIEGGFQPRPFSVVGYSPDVLRAIAQLVERYEP